MLKSVPIGILLIAAVLSPARASQFDSAILAAMKLADAPNYAWTARIVNEDDRGQTSLDGVTQKGGYTMIKDNNPSPYLRQKIGTKATAAVVAVFKGEKNCLIQTADGWLRPEELTGTNEPGSRRNAPRRGPGGGGPPGGGGGLPRQPSFEGVDPKMPLTFSVRRPQDELEIIVGACSEVQVAGDIFTGALTEGGAMQFLNSFGQPQSSVKRARGLFRCWIKEGVVVRYEIRVSGTVTLGTDKKEIAVNWILMTEIKDIGRTKVTIPDEAREILEV